MKAQLIAEIEAIYRDHNYRPRGKPLSDYHEVTLALHLERLQAGAYEWMKGKGKIPPSPPVEKGGEEERVQAFDVFREGGVHYFGLFDAQTGQISLSRPFASVSQIDEALNFLKSAWGSAPPKRLATDGGLPAGDKRFGEFLSEKGVEHCCLDSVDQFLRGRLERAGRRALRKKAGDACATKTI